MKKPRESPKTCGSKTLTSGREVSISFINQISSLCRRQIVGALHAMPTSFPPEKRQLNRLLPSPLETAGIASNAPTNIPNVRSKLTGRQTLEHRLLPKHVKVNPA